MAAPHLLFQSPQKPGLLDRLALPGSQEGSDGLEGGGGAADLCTEVQEDIRGLHAQEMGGSAEAAGEV